MSFGGWTIAFVKVLALELLEIHSLEVKLWTFAFTASVRWPTLVTLSAPTSVFAYASRTSAPYLQPQDHQFAFASTKSLQVMMDGVANSSLIGLPALVIPFGSTTSSALASASLPHKPMAVLSLPSRQRSCASRLEPNWPPQWKVASCVPQWALACASGTSVLCHQLRVLPCSLVSICWTRRAPPPSHWHMDPEISWAKSARQMLMFCYDTVNSLAAPKFLNTVFSSLLRICLLPAKETEWVMKHRCIAFCLWLEPCRTSQDGRKKSWRFKMSTCDSMVIKCDMCLYCACFYVDLYIHWMLRCSIRITVSPGALAQTPSHGIVLIRLWRFRYEARCWSQATWRILALENLLHTSMYRRCRAHENSSLF